MSTDTAVYVMNPAEDAVIFGEELAEGMLVIPESEGVRTNGSEDHVLRMNRFCRVTRQRWLAGSGATPEQTVFVGEWVDGFQKVMSFAVTHGWIAKKDPIPSGGVS